MPSPLPPLSAIPLMVLATTSSAWGQTFEADGVTESDFFGSALATIADLNGDGVVEFVVGAPGADYGAENAGSVYVLSGSDGAVLRRHDATTQDGRFGYRVVAAGDVDADGFEDYACSARRDNEFSYPSGLVRLYSGQDGSLIREFTSARNWDRFGHALANAGDVNGDGLPDLLVGAPDDDFAGIGTGSAFVYSGADGSPLHTLRGGSVWDRFGSSVAGLHGDVDGDGWNDFAIGVPRRENGFREAGAVALYSGRTGAVIRRAPGRERDAFFGTQLVAMGDVNADGVPDFAASGVLNESNLIGFKGYAQIRSGASNTALATMEYEQLGEGFGMSLGAADITGDGYMDLLVAAPLASYFGSTGVTVGLVRAYSGPSGRFLSEMIGEADGDRFGTSIAPLHQDLNGDGMQDVLIGAPGGGPLNAGRIQSRSGPRLAQLDLPSPVAGTTATLSMTQGIPFSQYKIEASLTGPGNAAPAGSPGLDLALPLTPVGTLTVDATGSGQMPVVIPSSAAGLPVWLQGWLPTATPAGSTRLLSLSIQ